jgi:hypothetical protein
VRVAGVAKAKGSAVATLGGADEGVVGTAGFVRKTHGRWTGAGRADFRECSHIRSVEMRSVSSGRRGEPVEC